MTRKIPIALILLATPALGGCAVQAALAAAELARHLPEPERPSNAHLKPAATEACRQRAAQHGSVFIIDVEQRRPDLIIMWGSVTDAEQRRRMFECHFTTAIVRFKLTQIDQHS